MKNAGKACNNRLYRHIRTFEKIVKNYFVIFFKKGQKVYIGICLKKFAAFAVCHEPISKRRFIMMSLMPMLLGIMPLVIFLLSSPNAFLSGICIPMGIIGMLSPMPDYMDVHIICKQVPKGALVHTQNDGFYWYK